MATREQIIDDPDLKLPAAVRKQAAVAQAAFEAQFGADDDAPADDAPVVDTDTNPEALLREPANPVAPPASDPPANDPPANDEDATWENRYNAMHGRFKQASADLKNAMDRIRNLESVMASMTATSDAPSLPELSADKLITPEDVNEYGNDLINVIGKKSRDEFVPLLKPLMDRIEAQDREIKSLKGSHVADKQQDLLSVLDKELPNWREVNTNDDFIAWLALPEPYSGAIRHALLDEAYKAGNSTRVLAFFRGFLAEEAALAPQREITPAPGTEVVPKTQLLELAAPGKAKTAAVTPQTPVEKPIITRAQIATFYADVSAGKYRGRDAEKARLEAMIFEAQADRRIR